MKDKQSYEVTAVKDHTTVKVSFDFPAGPNRDEKNRIRPLDDDIEKIFDPSRNKPFERARMVNT